MMRVLVTRAEPGASETAERLRALGFAPVVAPALTIEPVTHDPAPAEQAAALAFTSAAAARAWTGRRDVIAFAVGDATASALRAAGFTDVRSAGGDGADLAALIAAAMPPGPIGYIRGAAVAFDLAAALTPRGFHVIPIIVYAARADASLPLGMLDGLDAALFHSPAGARAFAERVRSGDSSDSLRAVRAICMSAAVAEPLSALPWKAVEIADAPTENALFARLTAAQG